MRETVGVRISAGGLCDRRHGFAVTQDRVESRGKLQEQLERQHSTVCHQQVVLQVGLGSRGWVFSLGGVGAFSKRVIKTGCKINSFFSLSVCRV